VLSFGRVSGRRRRKPRAESGARALRWAAWLACALVPAALLAGEPPRYEIVPDPAAAGSARIDGQVWVAENDLYVARVALLEDEARAKWLRDSAGVELDPFAAARQGSGPAFFTFLLSIERRGGGKLYFQPLACPATIPNGLLVNPLDLATIEAAYAMANRVVPPAYEPALRKVLLQDQMVLGEGARATGLLAYPARDLSARTLRLEVRLTTQAGDPLSFQIGFRRNKIKEERPRP